MIAIPYFTALTTYFSYGLLFVFGQFRDFFRKILDWWSTDNLQVIFFSRLRASFWLAVDFWFWWSRDMRLSAWDWKISIFGACITEFRYFLGWFDWIFKLIKGFNWIWLVIWLLNQVIRIRLDTDQAFNELSFFFFNWIMEIYHVIRISNL